MGYLCGEPFLATMTSRQPMWSDPSQAVGRVLEEGKVVATWVANTSGEIATEIEAPPGSPVDRPPMRVVLFSSQPGVNILGQREAEQWYVSVDGKPARAPFTGIRDERDARMHCTWYALAAFLGERYTDRAHPGMRMMKAMRFFTPPDYNRESAIRCP